MLANSAFCPCMFKHNMFNLSRLTFLRPTKIQLVVYSIIIAARNDAKLHLVAVCARALIPAATEFTKDHTKYRGAYFLFMFIRTVRFAYKNGCISIKCTLGNGCAQNLKFTSHWEYKQLRRKGLRRALNITA